MACGIATGWSATHHHEDSSEPSEIHVKIRDFQGNTHLDISNPDDDQSVGLTVWEETQLGELLAGLIAAAKQADYDMLQVYITAGLPADHMPD